MSKFYEIHLLENKPLPFIFHRSYVIKGREMGDNKNWHPNVELLYFVKGSAVVSCEANDYEVFAGDIFVVNSNEAHAINSSDCTEYHCLIIDSRFLMQNNIDIENIVLTHIVKDKTAAELFECVAEEYTAEDMYKNAAVRAAVLRLSVYIVRNYVERNLKFDSSQASSEGIRAALGYIGANFMERISLDMLSERACMSKYYFLREFKKQVGHTPVEYINILRCESAKKMISMGRYSIREVCERTGFENMSYFSRLFKNYVGCTPSEYKKRKMSES